MGEPTAKTQITIKIRQVGGDRKEVTVTPGTSLQEVLGEAGVSVQTDAVTIRVGKEPVQMEMPMEQDCTVVITPKVEKG